MLEEVLRLQLDPDSGQRSFQIRPDMVEKANQMLLQAGVLTKGSVKMEDIRP